MTRGVLIDVAGLKGVDTLPDTYEITVQDLQQALRSQNLTLQSGRRRAHQHRLGQAVGKGQRALHEDRPGHRGRRRRMAGQAGPDAGRRGQLARWRSRRIPTRRSQLPVHQIMLVVNGIHLLENLKLDELAAKGVYEFAFVMQPLKIQGGTGSTVAPVAIR